MCGIEAEPQVVESIDDCYFYHTMELPGHGVVKGEWDLRGKEAAYLGGVDFRGKHVLEIGTASGCLCFWMEQQGARVVAYDLSDRQDWDLVPYADSDAVKSRAERREHLRRLNRGFWFAHRLFQSTASMVYGTVYDMPAQIGQFDITTVSAVLRHVRDPFLALQRAAERTNETIIVVESPWAEPGDAASFTDAVYARFVPTPQNRKTATWWQLGPKLVRRWLAILGFHHIEIRRGLYSFQGVEQELFTAVGRR